MVARLAAQGLDGLPDHLPNHELQGSSAHYPLAMISPPARNFLNSTFVNVQSLRDIEGRPVLEIHPDDALARGIGDGAVVRVFNDRGSYRCHAAVSLRARPGVETRVIVTAQHRGLLDQHGHFLLRHFNAIGLADFRKQQAQTHAAFGQFAVIGLQGVVILAFLPWLDRSPVKSIRYRGPIY